MEVILAKMAWRRNKANYERYGKWAVDLHLI